MLSCRCCAEKMTKHLFSSKLLEKTISYFECDKCEYVQTEDPIWLEEAYTTSINTSDTGIMSRNLSNSSLVLSTLSLMGERKSCVVDYAGGYGLLVRLLRDFGVDALWADAYSENLVAKGFEYQKGRQAALVTAFEAYEHFEQPAE